MAGAFQPKHRASLARPPTENIGGKLVQGIPECKVIGQTLYSAVYSMSGCQGCCEFLRFHRHATEIIYFVRPIHPMHFSPI